MYALRIVLPALILSFALVATSAPVAHADPSKPDVGIPYSDTTAGGLDWAILNTSRLHGGRLIAVASAGAWVSNVVGRFGPTDVICDVVNGNPPSYLTPNQIDLHMGVFRLQSDLARPFDIYGTAIAQFEHAVRLQSLGCPDDAERAVVFCVHARYNTPGDIQASPRFGIVNVRSMFWITGMLAQPFNSWLLNAGRQTSYEWDPHTAPPRTDGIYLKTHTNFHYIQNGYSYDIPCNTLGGFVDPNHPLGRFWDDAHQNFLNGRKHQTSVGPIKPRGDANKDGVSNDQILTTGIVHIERFILPATMELDLTVDFGPWYWYFSGGRQPDLARTYSGDGPGTSPPSSGQNCDGSTLRSGLPGRACAPFELMIAGDSSIRRQPTPTLSGDSATPTQIQEAIDDYDGPTFVYDQHGAYPVQAIVNRTLKPAPFRVRVRDEYEWEERWRIDQWVNESFRWIANRHCNAYTGSTCESAIKTREVGPAKSWISKKKVPYIYDYTYYDCPPPNEKRRCGSPNYRYRDGVRSDCATQYYIQYRNAMDKNCSYTLTDEYRHHYHSYWTCKGNRAYQRNFRWYEPGGTTSAADGSLNRHQRPTGMCLVTHTTGYEPIDKATLLLSGRPLIGVRRIYDYDAPPLAGQDVTRDVYPVRRRFPVIVDQR